MATNYTTKRGKTMLAKWNANKPYFLFFNKLARSADTHEQKNAVSFTELICPSMGPVKCSLHITNNVDINWLMHMYTIMNLQMTPVTLIYGTLDRSNDLETIHSYYPLLTFAKVGLEPFGKHNSKMSIFKYHDNSVRIVISTADLTNEDWNIYNNGLWISPLCPPVFRNTGNKHDSSTYFKANLIYYLDSYRMDIIQPWIETLQVVDFSAIKVFLIASIPGEHQKGRDNHVHVVSNLLKKYCFIPRDIGHREENIWNIIAMSPSIGNLGPNFSHWLKFFVASLSNHKRYAETSTPGHFDFIHPSDRNIREGYWGQYTTTYTSAQHNAQKWFQKNLHPWKANQLKRTKAMPHIRCYTRLTPCQTKSLYFLLTSADIGEDGWGHYLGARQVLVRNYELGVLFMPRFFDEKIFELQTAIKNRTTFPMIYDLPLRRYDYAEEPWLCS